MTEINYSKEAIPDEDKLYMRIEGQNAINNQTFDFSPSMIRQHGDDGISCDWSKYSDEHECLKRGKPAIDAVVSLIAGEVRRAPILSATNPKNLTVEHKPRSDNQSHALIVKLDKSRKAPIRNALMGLITVEIPGNVIKFL